jgi:hypothetical protein
MTPITPVAVIITGPDAQRTIHRADTRANSATNDRADRARRAVAFMRAFFSPADKTLRLGNNRERKRSDQTRGSY